MTTSKVSSCATIQQWEDASASLTATLEGYMDLCGNLSPNSFNDTADDFGTRIDTAADAISDRLLEIRSTLGKTRNRLVTPIHRLPEEILSAIFTNLVFDFGLSEVSESPSIERDLCLIYTRLYGLLGVCSTWRDIIMTRGAFWSVIPIVENPSTKKTGPFEPSIRRAIGSKLHLVAVAESPETSEDLIQVLTKYGHLFHTINLSIGDHQVIVDAVEILIQQNASRSLSELSIQSTHVCNASDWLPTDDSYVLPFDYAHQGSFTSLIGALSAFRISGAHFCWQTVTFSARLVELAIENITLGYDHGIEPFLQTLCSASELRDLRIRTLDTFFDLDSMDDIDVPFPVVFPRLQTLHLQDIFFNTLKCLLSTIAPGSHRLTLFLEPASLRNNLHEVDNHLQPHPELADVDIGDLCDVLEQVPVHTLMLSGTNDKWLTGAKLRRLLEAIPAMKILKIHDCDFDRAIWTSLKGPRIDETGPQEYSFSALENIQLSKIAIHTKRGFQDLVASHPLQQLALGGTSTRATSSNEIKHKPLEKRSTMVRWLRYNVPEFHLFDSEHCPPEFQFEKWPL